MEFFKKTKEKIICQHIFKADIVCLKEYELSTGISSLKYHLTQEHKMIMPPKNMAKRIKKNVDDLMVNWIIDDQQAFQVVENRLFRKLVAELDPSYKVPTRQKVSSMVYTKYDKISEEKLKYLQQQNGNIFKYVDFEA